jgi:hypothetical protein
MLIYLTLWDLEPNTIGTNIVQLYIDEPKRSFSMIQVWEWEIVSVCRSRSPQQQQRAPHKKKTWALTIVHLMMGVLEDSILLFVNQIIFPNHTKS